MAEYGAHITITAKDRPSIFDVVAQDGLMSTLQPAVKHIMKVIAESNPEKHGWCLKYSGEIFMVFDLVIQHHYLSNYGASFAENFYDLKRVQLKANGSIKPLTLSNETYTKSLLALGAFPYLRSQMDSVYQDIQEKDADGRLSEEGWKVKIQKVVLKVWPLLHLSWELLTLIYYIRYLIGRSRFHSPLLLLTGVRLANLDKEDYEIIDARAEQLLSFTNVRSLQDLGQWLMEQVGSSLMNSLEVGAFFLQFLDWFYSSGNTPRSLMTRPIPPPPQTAGIQSISGLKTEDCPICFKTRKQDTVLSVSGYVFCYSCILPYVRRENKCPVTGYPASTTQVIRIYQEI
ncbi:peroxisome assembly protein 12-like [Homarus americanus]|uniref:peroxisome assembly protein 12-like n=1 Tax=Homarus americanus TaxID=6706 RepID=UPI001C48DAE5|nr:peroxisome assembly protein 12-like [Homarus americanus]